jgi:glyoxylase-like metal-dependent hydrolase (beta-lactamase superfamily II)
VPDRAGQLPSPPPYYDVDGYLETLRRLRELRPEWLLTAHYSVIRGAEVDAFFAESLAFVERVDVAVLDALRTAARPLTLREVVAALDARLGPFAIPIQWIGPALGHLARHIAAGRLAQHNGGAARAWAAM